MGQALPGLRKYTAGRRADTRAVALDGPAGLGVVGELPRWMREKGCRPQTSRCLRAGVRGPMSGETGRAL